MSTLPLPFTTLVGREDDIAYLSTLLDQPHGAIVTLVGPAGVGKTRLAIAVASATADLFRDGVVYVDLASVTDVAFVIPAIARAVGLADSSGSAGQLARFLSDRSLLLVIDNFEQVRGAGAAVNSVIGNAPHVRALITSQAPLRVHSERAYTVEPLGIPDSLDRAGADAAAQAPAVRLFVERARVVRPGFSPTDANLPAIVAICRHLDGLPLAIELAAARSNVLSPEALFSRLSASLHLLTGGPRDAPDRHQALRAAIEWSYGLLSPEEKLLLERLSVFAGSFSLTAAEAIAGNAPIRFAPSMYVEAGEPLPADDSLLAWDAVFELLDGLVEHSLVQRVESPDGEPRFRLFQTIRQLAADKLAARGEGQRTALRHAVWFHALAESAWMENGVPGLEQIWLDSLERDNENLLAALDFLSDSDPETASVFASALIWFFYIRGRRREGIRLMRRAIETVDRGKLRPEAAARFDFALGSLLMLFPESHQEGMGYLEQVLVTLRELGHDWGAGYTLLALAVRAEDTGDYQQSLDYIDEAWPLLVAVNDAPTLANVRFHQAVNFFGLEDLVRARDLATSVADAHLDDAGLNIGYAKHLLGMIELAEGNTRKAARRFLESLDFSIENGMVGTATELIDAAAALVAPIGDPEDTIRLFGAADRLNDESGNPVTLPEVTYYDAARERARATMSAVRYHELLAEGRAMSMEAGLAAARATLVAIEAGATSAPVAPPSPQRDYGLTTREREVLQLMAVGMSDREIGNELFISLGTARTHVRNILGKMDVHSRAAATGIALREGIVSPTETD